MELVMSFFEGQLLLFLYSYQILKTVIRLLTIINVKELRWYLFMFRILLDSLWTLRETKLQTSYCNYYNFRAIQKFASINLLA